MDTQETPGAEPEDEPDEGADEGEDEGVAVDPAAAIPDASAEQLAGDPGAGLPNEPEDPNEPGVSDEVRGE